MKNNKEKSKVEKSIERKMKAKGFEVTMLKQYISKTIYEMELSRK